MIIGGASIIILVEEHGGETTKTVGKRASRSTGKNTESKRHTSAEDRVGAPEQARTPNDIGEEPAKR